jgi:hypothetical protein
MSRGEGNKLYSNDNHSHFEREKRYLERGATTLQGSKKFLKNFQKPLDKQTKI